MDFKTNQFSGISLAGSTAMVKQTEFPLQVHDVPLTNNQQGNFGFTSTQVLGRDFTFSHKFCTCRAFPLQHLQTINLNVVCIIFASHYENTNFYFSPNQEDRSWGQEQMSHQLHHRSLVGRLAEKIVKIL